MNKSIVLFLILALTACSSAPTQEEVTETAPRKASEKVMDAPALKKEEPKPVVEEEPPKPQPPAPPSQYAALNDAIKEQNDEKIHQGATQILAQSPNDARALNALAMYHYKRGRFELCRFLLNKAIAANPKIAELYSNLGIVQLAQGEKRDAVKSFRKALEINDDEAVAASNLGAIYAQEKDFGKAQVALETAYKRGVRDARVLNNYAIALTAHGKYEKAADLYRTIIKENSSNKEYLYNYATLLVENMGKYQDGLDVINRLKFVGGPADTRNKIINLENKAKAGLK